jgi:MFS family permease
MRPRVLLGSCFFLSLLTVPLLGGRVVLLADLHFKRVWAVVAAVVTQSLVLGAFPEGDAALHASLHLFSYVLLGWFVCANFHIPCLWIVALGGFMNALAIAANQGQMPAHPDAIKRAGLVEEVGEFANSATLANPNLQFLGDVFATPPNLPISNVFSLGDMLLVLGAGLLMHRVCGSALGELLDRMGRWIVVRTPRFDLVREHPSFRRLWYAQAISNLGDWIYPLAVFTAAVGDDASPASLSFLLVAQVGPGVLVGIFGGPLVDRLDRRLLMIGTDVVRMLAVGSLLFTPDPSLGHLYGVAMALGIGGALFQPCLMASLPNLVARKHLTSANALIGATYSCSVMMGPLVGAIVVSGLGISWGFAANAASFAVSALLVASARLPMVALDERARRTLTRELVSGLQYVRSNKTVRNVLIVVALITLGAGIKSPLEPIFALRDLDAGPTGLGLLGAFWGVGMAIGSLTAARAARRWRHGQLLSVSVFVVAGTVLLSSMSPSVTPILMLWLCAGAANTLGTVAYETLLQQSTPDRFRGRVMAAAEASLEAGLLGGVLIAGVLGSVIGARGGLAISGVVFLFAAGMAWRLLANARVVPVRDTLVVEALEVVPATPSLALARIRFGGMLEPVVSPVLLIDDGSQVHRLQPLPGGEGQVFGFPVPRAVAEKARAAFAVEVPEFGRFDVARTAPTVP